MEITGSYLGAFGDIMHASSKVGCGASTYIGNQTIPEAGCSGDGIYAESRWKPNLYFASRDAQWKATVTVGDIKTSTAPVPSDATGEKPADEH